jgi:hypothetical protein
MTYYKVERVCTITEYVIVEADNKESATQKATNEDNIISYEGWQIESIDNIETVTKMTKEEVWELEREF